MLFDITVSGLYGFSASGTYRVKAHQDFKHLDGEAGLVPVHATSGPGHVVSIIDNPIGRRAPQSTFINCTVARQNQIAIVMDAVKRIVISAHQYVAQFQVTLKNRVLKASIFLDSHLSLEISFPNVL